MNKTKSIDYHAANILQHHIDLQRLKTAQNIKRMRHEYYMATPGCTIKRAATFLPNIPITIISQYSRLRTECLDVINAVIDMRYWHRGAQRTKEA